MERIEQIPSGRYFSLFFTLIYRTHIDEKNVERSSVRRVVPIFHLYIDKKIGTFIYNSKNY